MYSTNVLIQKIVMYVFKSMCHAAAFLSRLEGELPFPSWEGGGGERKTKFIGHLKRKAGVEGFLATDWAAKKEKKVRWPVFSSFGLLFAFGRSRNGFLSLPFSSPGCSNNLHLKWGK